MCRNSLYCFYNCSVSVTLVQSKKIKKEVAFRWRDCEEMDPLKNMFHTLELVILLPEIDAGFYQNKCGRLAWHVTRVALFIITIKKPGKTL